MVYGRFLITSKVSLMLLTTVRELLLWEFNIFMTSTTRLLRRASFLLFEGSYSDLFISEIHELCLITKIEIDSNKKQIQMPYRKYVKS